MADDHKGNSVSTQPIVHSKFFVTTMGAFLYTAQQCGVNNEYSHDSLLQKWVVMMLFHTNRIIPL